MHDGRGPIGTHGSVSKEGVHAVHQSVWWWGWRQQCSVSVLRQLQALDSRDTPRIVVLSLLVLLCAGAAAAAVLRMVQGQAVLHGCTARAAPTAASAGEVNSLYL
jgi:hypothetical protein